ncbi:MAG: PKD domain-containing protein [Crocinitomicaceae bacterium]
MKKLIFFFGIFFTLNAVYAQEICNNGIDDDADGDIDMNDADCACNGLGGSGSTVTSLIPNPSFESNSCCPNGVSDLHCADSWVQASNATSDYFNTCGYTGIFNSPDLPLPGAPGGAGYGGFYSNANWEENIGACLNSPMTAGTPYTLDFNMAWSTGATTLNVTLYGTPNCGDLPWNTSTCAVGSGAWIVLGTATVTFPANQSWQQVTINFIPPVNINAVSIGGPCGGQQAGSNYYFLDELTLNTTASFSSGDITESGNWCSNDLTLDATIDTTGGTWQWYEDGIALVGETSASLNMMSLGAGNYSAVYTVGGECQQIDYTLTLPVAPTADYNFTNECQGTAINFTDASSIPAPGTIDNWDWDFGDGNTSTAQNPSHSFASDGTYSVDLVVTDNNGCQHTSTQNVTVYPNPTADFEFVINGVSSNTGLTGGCIADAVSFVNNSNVNAPDNITTWAWDFGDGTTSNLQNPPAHNYATEGNYNITLTTTSNNGCTDQLVVPITIEPTPVADFTVTDECLGINADFMDNSSVTTGVISGWDWDFGDGNTSTAQNPSHPYASEGTYTVTLTVTSDMGCTAQVQNNTTRFPIPTADFTMTDECEYNSSVISDNSSVVAPDVISTYLWDFGDGNTSALPNPGTHQYATYGTYNVELTVTSSSGCQDNLIVPVNIHAEPNASYTVSDDCVDQAADFVNTSSIPAGSIATWQWDLGDGTTGGTQHANYLYASSGAYVTELIAISDMGCEDTMSITTTRHAMPTAAFTVNDECIYDAITVTDNSVVGAPDVISGYVYDFDDGNGSTNANDTHLYGIHGNYAINLEVTTDKGCQDNITVPVTIYPQPVPAFTTNTICVNTPPTNFVDNSAIPSGTISTWDWDFGDGTNGSGQGTQHAYGSSGSFNATLTLTSDFGCTNAITQPVTVYEKPTAGFVSDVNQACSPATINFTDLSFSATASIDNWQWEFFGGAASAGQHPSVNYYNENSSPELYDVELIVTNSLGCKDTALISDYIEIFPTPEAEFVFNPQVLTITDSETQFTNTSVNSDEWAWNFGDNSLTNTQEHPTHTFPDHQAATYEVELIAYNYGQMCSDTTSLIVNVQDVIIFYAPNIFTPDGDDFNETWKPVFFSGYDPFDFHLLIYNRWGEVIWESYNADAGWNGHYGNGGLVDDGTYIWQLDFKETMSDKRHQHSGHVTVLK